VYNATYKSKNLIISYRLYYQSSIYLGEGLAIR